MDNRGAMQDAELRDDTVPEGSSSTGSGQPDSRGVARRLIHGLGASALTPIVTVLIQLGTVPFLLRSWGAAKYGDWVILSAIPSYLILSNLGFGDASGSDMTVLVAAGDREGALETYQSSWLLLLSVSVLMLTLASLTVWVPWHNFLRLSSLSDTEASTVVLLLAAYVIVSQQCGILESGFRCDGNFATGSFLATVLRLSETLLGTMAGIWTGSLRNAALAYLLTRIAGTFAYSLALRRKSPWIRLGIGKARLATIRRLSAPALGFMALPLANAISIQGFTLMIASALGPTAVTSFSTLRTLTRVNLQLTGVIGWAIWPELSRAFGSGNVALARRLHRSAYQAGLALSVLTVGLLWFFGPAIYHGWIHNAVAFNRTCFNVLLLVTFVNSLWFTSSIVPMSTNAHRGITLALAGLSCVSLGLGWVLVRHIGLTGAAVALLLIDAVMFCIVLRTSLRQLQDNMKDFATAIFLTRAHLGVLK